MYTSANIFYNWIYFVVSRYISALYSTCFKHEIYTKTFITVPLKDLVTMILTFKAFGSSNYTIPLSMWHSILTWETLLLKMSPHSTLYSVHSTLHTIHSTLHTIHSTLHTPHSTLHTPHSTLYTPHSTISDLLNVICFTQPGF